MGPSFSWDQMGMVETPACGPFFGGGESYHPPSFTLKRGVCVCARVGLWSPGVTLWHPLRKATGLMPALGATHGLQNRSLACLPFGGSVSFWRAVPIIWLWNRGKAKPSQTHPPWFKGTGGIAFTQSDLWGILILSLWRFWLLMALGDIGQVKCSAADYAEVPFPLLHCCSPAWCQLQMMSCIPKMGAWSSHSCELRSSASQQVNLPQLVSPRGQGPSIGMGLPSDRILGAKHHLPQARGREGH